MLLATLAALSLPAIDIPPTDVKRALEILDPTHTRQVSRQLEREVVMVRADDRAQVFARLADVFEAEWTKQDDGRLILERSGTRQRELETAEANWLESEIAKELATPARVLAANKSPYDRAKLALADLDRVSEERSTGRAGSIAAGNGGVYDPVIRSPLRVLREEFLLALGAAKIARLPLDRAVIWSTTPTRAQSPLPANAKGIVGGFIETQAHLVGLAAGRKLPSGAEGWYERSAIEPGVGSTDFGDVLFMIYRSDAYIWTLVAAFDDKGKLRGREAGYIFQRRIGRLPSLGPQKPTPIEAPPLARLLFSPDPVTPQPADLENLLAPETLDPLAITTADAVSGLAEGRQIIARLPDDLGEAARRSYKDGKIDLDQFRREAIRSGARLTSDEGWLTIEPDVPTRCERMRLPRKALGSFMRASFGDADLNVREYSLFRYAAGGAIQGGVGSMYLRGLPNLGWPLFSKPGMLPGYVYAFLGSLSDSTWDRVIRGEKIDIGYLGATQRDLIRGWLNMSAPCLEREPGFDDVPDQLLTGSEANPNGDMRGVMFWIETKSRPAVKAVKRTDYLLNWFNLSAQDLGEQLGSILASDAVSEASQVTSATDWLFGSQLVYTLKAHLQPGIQASTETLAEATLDPKPRPFAELPEAFRAEVAAQAEKTRREMKGG